jgi:hypothetical protein
MLNTIVIKLNEDDNLDFIDMLKSIDKHIDGYITKQNKNIQRELEIKNEFKYEPILKIKPIAWSSNKSNKVFKDKFISSSMQFNKVIQTPPKMQYELIFKSYLDEHIITDLKQSSNEQYILTFNISHLYLIKNVLVPISKCNKCCKYIKNIL